MATVTVRPDASSAITYGGGAGAGLVGAASLHAGTADDSDASYGYFRPTAGNTAGATLSFANPTIPAGAQIRSITPRMRRRNYAGYNASFTLRTTGGVLAWAADVDLWTVEYTTGNFATLTGVAKTTRPDGSALQAADVADMEIVYAIPVNPGGGDSSRQLSEAYLDVVYNEIPVVTVTAPAEASTITNDSQPTVTWTYSDPESDAQERVRVKVFSAAQYGAGGFDPDTSTATWDSGEVFTSATSLEIGAQLANATYRAYVKAADAGSSGRYSAWDYNQFTINLSPPPDPTITATVQAAQARTKVDVTAAAGAPSTEFVMVEYSDDAGGSWATLRGGEKTTLAPSATLTVYDYEAPPGASRRYRARAGRAVA